jgi:hypothetical protein
MKSRAWLAKLAIVAGALGGLVAAPATAQLPLPLGLEQLLNSTLLGDQDEVVAAVLPDGNFVAVWRDSIIDGFLSAIVGRRFSARTGLPLSGEFLVNLTVVGDQRNPAIAMAADGRFVVVWEGPDATLTSSYGVFGSLRAANGTAIVAEFPINVATDGTQERPAVAMQPNGGFLVAWQDDLAPTLGSDKNIVGRIYPANFPSNPPGNPFLVNTAITAGDQEQPAAAAIAANGGWYVGWQGPSLPPVIPSIFVRMVNGSGAGPDEFPVNSSAVSGPRAHTALSTNASGDAVAVWEAPDQNHRGIFSRRIAAGGPVGAEEQVNLSRDLDEREPAVALDERGDFVTVWVVADPGAPFGWRAPEGSPIVIQGRKKNASAGFTDQPPPTDAEFQVNTGGTEFLDPWLAAEPRGNFVVAWQGTHPADPDGTGVFVRRFLDALFADDFETQDTSRWSATLP